MMSQARLFAAVLSVWCFVVSAYGNILPPPGVGHSDILTVNAPGLSGTAGYVVPSFTVAGAFTPYYLAWISDYWEDSVGGADAMGSELLVLQNIKGVIEVEIPYRSIPLADGVLSFDPIPFHFGQPFELNFVYRAAIFSPYPAPVLPADFSAVLSGLNVFDSKYRAIANPVFTSALGVSYSTSGVVPEPASLLMLVTGLAACAVLRLRKR